MEGTYIRLFLVNGKTKDVEFTHEDSYPVDIFLHLYHSNLKYRSFKIIKGKL